MAVDKLKTDDARVQHQHVNIRGKKYHYILGEPQDGRPVATILLLHGFPDLSMGWRYQIPLLMSLGLRVVAPDSLGYGQTDSPQALEAYSMKSTANDMAELARHFVGADGQILLGGHDWGATLAWHLCLWHADLVKAVFGLCVPYQPPLPVYLDLPALVKRLPNFTYQVQLAGPDVEREIVGEEKIRQFLNCMFGGVDSTGSGGFEVTQGLFFDKLSQLGPSPLMDRAELDYYTKQYARTGMRGPLNWYRTRQINYEEEIPLLQSGKTRITAPSMLIMAKKDAALPLAMADRTEKYHASLRKELVDTSHWALVQSPGEVNEYIRDFLSSYIGPGADKAHL
jgi:soluble epoxide hydrolase / lipid-phosphate phosphatase